MKNLVSSLLKNIHVFLTIQTPTLYIDLIIDGRYGVTDAAIVTRYISTDFLSYSDTIWETIEKAKISYQGLLHIENRQNRFDKHMYVLQEDRCLRHFYIKFR